MLRVFDQNTALGIAKVMNFSGCFVEYIAVDLGSFWELMVQSRGIEACSCKGDQGTVTKSLVGDSLQRQ